MIFKRNIALIIFIILSIWGCIDKLKSPVLPIWDAQYSIPVISRTETISERIKGTRGIFIDSTSQYLLLKFDSSEVTNKSLDDIFSDNLKFEGDFSIKPQNVDTIIFESFVSDDSVYLDEFHLYKGNIFYEVRNYLDKEISLSLVFPGFTKQIGSNIDTLKFQINVPANTKRSKQVDLSNYHYNKSITNPLGGSNNYGFYVKGYAAILGSDYSGDSVSMSININKLGFNYFKGKVKPYRLEIKSKYKAIDYDKELNDILPKIYVYGAKLIISPNTSITNLEVQLKNFRITGLFKSGAPKKYLRLNNKSVIDTIISLDRPSIEFSLDNFSINEFISPEIPDTIGYEGEIIINPNYKTLELSLPDTLKLEARLNLYTIFKIDNPSRTDTIEITLDDKAIKNIDRLKSGELTLDIDNGFPIGFRIVGYFLDSLNQKLLYFTREKGTGEVSDTTFWLRPAQVNSEGLVISSVKQKKIIKLNSDEIEKLKKIKKAIIRVLVYSTEGKKVMLTSKDKVSIKGIITLTAHVNLGD